MRLWHKDLIDVLPDKQLISQWRECCAIVKAIHDNGTPNHILVNKVMKFPPSHLYTYTTLVLEEMARRGFHSSGRSYQNYTCRMYSFMAEYRGLIGEFPWDVPMDDLFVGWHNLHYLTQCFCNLQEKHDCGGITDEEWDRIDQRYMELIRDSSEMTIRLAVSHLQASIFADDAVLLLLRK